MLGNHALFVGRNDIDGDAAVRPRYLQPVPRILMEVERDAQPLQLVGDPRANACRVLADAGGEDKGVEALQCRREHAGIKIYPVDEVVDRKRCARIGACLELTHIVADAGQSLQSALPVEKILYLT